MYCVALLQSFANLLNRVRFHYPKRFVQQLFSRILQAGLSKVPKRIQSNIQNKGLSDHYTPSAGAVVIL